MGCSLCPSGWVFWLWFLFLGLPWWVGEGSRQLCLVVFCLVGVIFVTAFLALVLELLLVPFFSGGFVLCLSGDDKFSQWPPLCWFVVLLWQSCMSYHPLPLWITRSNFPWVLMALLVLLMTSAMIWHLYPHPTRWLVLMVTKFLRSLIPIQVWCWALLFPSHDGAW